MRRGTSFLTGAAIAAAVCAFGLSPARAADRRHFATASNSSGMRVSWRALGQSYYYPLMGYGYYSPQVYMPSFSVPYPYAPKYWWTGYYPTEDPRQAGYNPSAGYNWQEVTALILTTYPAKAEVILDGSPIGSADSLGPIQLPIGKHTLKVEAPGYEPSETVIQVEKPSVQHLQINLKSISSAAAANRPR
jgi:hypothetical protein